jgi:hypothetical protein
MKRLKPYEIYRLGAIKLLRILPYETMSADDMAERFVPVIIASRSFEMKHPELKGAAAQASALRQQIRTVWNERKADELQEYSIPNMLSSLDKLENILEYELDQQHAYLIEKVGIYDTDNLIDHADQHLSATASQVVSDEVKEDFKAAGRCLAFDLFTACGFHAVRALEATARIYYKQNTGKDAAQTDRPLGGMANDLRDVADDKNGKPPKPLPKDHIMRLIISNLDRMNNIYRKPITHPEMVLKTRDDAKNVFDLASVSIALIAEQIRP